MKFGHHGANHPVQDLATGQVMITSQNHGFAVDEDVARQHRNDASLAVRSEHCRASHSRTSPRFSFQGHPEASPGPHDLVPLFERFIQLHGRGSKRRGLKAMLSS